MKAQARAILSVSAGTGHARAAEALRLIALKALPSLVRHAYRFDVSGARQFQKVLCQFVYPSGRTHARVVGESL